METCPFGANYYDENGLVRNDPKRCIGCNYCIASCPYDARWSHPITGLQMCIRDRYQPSISPLLSEFYGTLYVVKNGCVYIVHPETRGD